MTIRLLRDYPIGGALSFELDGHILSRVQLERLQEDHQVIFHDEIIFLLLHATLPDIPDVELQGIVHTLPLYNDTGAVPVGVRSCTNRIRVNMSAYLSGLAHSDTIAGHLGVDGKGTAGIEGNISQVKGI